MYNDKRGEIKLKTNEELFIEYQKEADSYKKESILNTLFKQNENFPHHIAKKFNSAKIPYDEIVNIATVGMVKALKTYDPNNTKFISYCGLLMEQEISMELRKSEYKKELVSMETPIGGDGNIFLENIIPDNRVNFVQVFEARSTVKKALENATLKGRELEIILNELSDFPKTQQELGEQFNVTQAQISRIRKSAYKKLKDVI